MNAVINFFLLLVLRKRIPNYIGHWSVQDGKIVRRLYPFGHRYVWIWDRSGGTTALDRFAASQTRSRCE